MDEGVIKSPCGGEAAGRSPADRGKQGTKRSVLTKGEGIPLGTVVAVTNRHDSPLLRRTPETMERFGFDLPEQITVHLGAGYDSKATGAASTADAGCPAVGRPKVGHEGKFPVVRARVPRR